MFEWFISGILVLYLILSVFSWGELLGCPDYYDRTKFKNLRAYEQIMLITCYINGVLICIGIFIIGTILVKTFIFE